MPLLPDLSLRTCPILHDHNLPAIWVPLDLYAPSGFCEFDRVLCKLLSPVFVLRLALLLVIDEVDLHRVHRIFEQVATSVSFTLGIEVRVQ